MSPYGQGWVLVVEVSDPAELDKLWDAAKYEQTYAHE